MPQSGYPFAATVGQIKPPNWANSEYRNQVELVVSDKEVGRIWGASGPWVGLTPDDSPMVMRDVSLTEIYALDWEAP